MGLWSFLEGYTGATTWNIILAVSILVIIYLTGLLNMQISDFIISKFLKKDTDEELKLFVFIAALNNDAITEKYIEMKILKEFFQSCFFAFIILGIGTFLSFKWAGNYKIFTYILGSGLLIIGLICPVFAKDYYNRLFKLVEFAKSEIVD